MQGMMVANRVNADGLIGATLWGQVIHHHEPRSRVSPGYEEIEPEHIDTAEVEVCVRGRWFCFQLTDEEQIAAYLNEWAIDVWEEEWTPHDDGPDEPDPDDQRDMQLDI